MPGNGFDASNRDGGDACAIPLADAEQCINIQLQPTLGMYQPDAIANYTVDNEKIYFVTANEGDARDYDGFSEEFRVGDDEYVLDAGTFSNADELSQDSALGRLKVTNTIGDIDGDGDFDQIYSYGARSFSIWNSAGALVFDSGDDFEQQLLALQNAGTDVWVDGRSDDKGPEPESLIVANIDDRAIAFIGLERVSGVIVYDVSNPFEAEFIGYINTKESGDISPEGLFYVPRSDKSGVLVVTNEESNTTSSYSISIDELEPPVGSDVECEYIIDDEWNRGYIGRIRLTNNGDSPVTGWTVNWTYTDDAYIDQLWNANLQGNAPTYSASELSWNGTINPGSFVQFGMKNIKATENAPSEIPQLTGDICD